jgi:hypothetical protein
LLHNTLLINADRIASNNTLCGIDRNGALNTWISIKHI